MNPAEVAELHAAWLKACEVANRAYEVRNAAAIVADNAADEERRARAALNDAVFGVGPYAYPRQQMRSR